MHTDSGGGAISFGVINSPIMPTKRYEMEKRWSTPGILKVSGLNPRPFEFNMRPNKNNMQDLYKFRTVNPQVSLI